MSLTELKLMIWQTVAAIPQGKVATYGDIARRCGYPGHARFVGTSLKNLPEDSVLPWHRVIKANGELAFAVGTDAFIRQKTQLGAEGVPFKQQKISLKTYRWH
ncbi:MAG: methylated-DNA--[protein]-cysteine S-methyltransferase [Methylophaga sp.]|nr:methylated-DNA--[protein]-cysteine S-methyltransferase [Methylophaga sp.]